VHQHAGTAQREQAKRVKSLKINTTTNYPTRADVVTMPRLALEILRFDPFGSELTKCLNQAVFSGILVALGLHSALLGQSAVADQPEFVAASLTFLLLTIENGVCHA